MDELLASTQISLSGMKAQARRLRVVSQNMANADSIAKVSGGAPYQRQLIVFRDVMDRNIGGRVVQANRVIKDQAPFGRRFEPSSPAADENGYVLTPNVNMLIEMMDMRQAQRAYEANLAVMNLSKDMTMRILDSLNS
ncbi:MAG: flagellar basal body rod protein FlgC [Alphaproteobacteria bacterium]|nr:flagellar basal body rod protein FlgC [Alphaproteobacteria bacterium]